MKNKKQIIGWLSMFVFFGSIAFYTSCKKEKTNTPASIAIVSGNNQTGILSKSLAEPLKVIVKDQDGNPYSGAKVNFTANNGSSVSQTQVTTGTDGTASVTWTMGSSGNTQTLTVTASKTDGTTALTNSPLTFTATIPNIEPYSIAIVSGNNQAGTLSTALAQPVKVIVKDQAGNIYTGAKVNLKANNGGTVSQAQVLTGTDGTASVTWTMGSSGTTQTLTVTAFKTDGTTALTNSPLTFTATIPASEPYSIAIVSGNNQTGTLSKPLAQPVKVIVKDQTGNSYTGAKVNFTANNGGTASQAQITTGTDGTASITWTMGSSGTTQTLTVTAFKTDGTTALTNSPLTFTATTSAPANEPYSIAIVSGNNQTGTLSSPLAQPIKVIVKDQTGNSYTGAKVNFTANNGGTASQTQVTTGTDGTTSVTWTLGSSGTTQTLTVTAFKTDGTTPLTNSPLTFSATATAASTGNTVTDIDGNVYNTVTIGTQVWMKENLKVTKYNDGTAIPLVTDNTAWSNLITPGYCWYKNDAATYKNTYGALYNWYAVSTNKLAPKGWHVPTDAEWTTLVNYLGGTTVAGGKLKEAGTSHWLSPNTGATNSSGFTALPGSVRLQNGTFDIEDGGAWWSSTDYPTNNAWFRSLFYGRSNENRDNIIKSYGLSVRCIKD